jgi:hypothetical protein
VPGEVMKKPITIKGWPFPVYGKITQATKENILPKPQPANLVDVFNSLAFAKRRKDLPRALL